MAVYPTDILGATDLIGGGDGAVDDIPTADLEDLDGVLAITDDGAFIYSVDSTSAAVENSPYVIKPDDEVGDKRLLLQRMSESAFEVGTVQIFIQSTAPVGWTKKTDLTDLSMLIYTTGNIGSGGSDDSKNWTTAITVDTHAITEAELPVHHHSVDVPAFIGNSGSVGNQSASHTHDTDLPDIASGNISADHSHTYNKMSGGTAIAGGVNYTYSGAQTGGVSANHHHHHNHPSRTSGNQSADHTHVVALDHDHAAFDSADTGSGNAHGHTLGQDTFTPKYQTVIAATKD